MLGARPYARDLVGRSRRVLWWVGLRDEDLESPDSYRARASSRVICVDACGSTTALRVWRLEAALEATARALVF